MSMIDASSSEKGSKRGNWSAMSLLENSDPKEEILMELQKEGTSSEVQEEDSVEETFHSLLDLSIPLKKLDGLVEGKEQDIIVK